LLKSIAYLLAMLSDFWSPEWLAQISNQFSAIVN